MTKKEEKIKSFRDLIMWQKAIDLAVLIYEMTRTFPKEERYGLISQLRRASVSVSSNIAEGFKRGSRKEKAQFYAVALGSIAEVESQLEIAKRIGYIDNENHKMSLDYISEVAKMLEGLVKSAQDKP